MESSLFSTATPTTARALAASARDGNRRRAALAALAALTAATGLTLVARSARANDAPVGTWIDQTGRGAVEISYCGSNLCGRVVWLKDAVNEKACGMAILGNLRPGPGGTWSGGWIYDPDREQRFDVELTPMGERMKVLGFAGIKLFGETVMWTRAPAGLRKCSA